MANIGAHFRVHGALNDLLPPRRRHRAFDVVCPEHASIKHTAEALGIPHTEVGIVLLDGWPADLAQRVPASGTVDLHPAPPPGAPLRFVADVHLAGLARRLRLLGFDCVLAGDGPDDALARQAERDERIVLTRDRELLKHRRVARGRFVRALRTDAQAGEVIEALALRAHLRPFTRCLECNGELSAAGADEVADRIPAAVALAQREFARCEGCGRIYWPGSHWRRLSALVEAARAG
ncbi:MAG: Mut7-C RNAse domain-containing protein [Burkholderiaceae bacterium]